MGLTHHGARWFSTCGEPASNSNRSLFRHLGVESERVANHCTSLSRVLPATASRVRGSSSRPRGGVRVTGEDRVHFEREPAQPKRSAGSHRARRRIEDRRRGRQTRRLLCRLVPPPPSRGRAPNSGRPANGHPARRHVPPSGCSTPGKSAGIPNGRRSARPPRRKSPDRAPRGNVRCR